MNGHNFTVTRKGTEKMNYVFEQKIKIITGWGCIDRLPELMKDEGYKKPLIVCDQVVWQIGLLERIANLLKQNGIVPEVFDGVQPDPPAEVIDKGAEFCRQKACDSILAVGGGSTIDTAKGINILRFNEGKMLDYAHGEEYKPTRGLICIPTTAGTGSELSYGMIVTDTENELKLPVHAYGEFAVIDPELTATMPESLTVSTGLDVFSHAFEGYTSIASNPMADAVCEKIMADVCRWLPVAKTDPDHREARQRMATAASLGGWMLSNGCAHVGHSLAHVLGAKYHIPHGTVCSYTLPVTMEVIAEAVPEKVKYAGEILDVKFNGTESGKEIGTRTAEAYRRFRDGLSGGKKAAVSVPEKDVPALAREVVKEAFAGLTPVPVDQSLAEYMLRHIS